MNRSWYSLPAFAVRRPVTILMLFGVLILWGLVSFQRIPVELLPNASFNNISILIQVRGGMPPEAVEKMITIPIEEAMSTLARLKSVQSTSKEGRATIVLAFPAGTDMDIASLEVSERFDTIKNDLPREVERPVIAKYEQNDVPIMILALSSQEESVEELRQRADKDLKPGLQRIGGVANVEVSGGRERKIVVEVDETELAARQLDIQHITDAIGRNNLNRLAGTVDEARLKYLLRTEAQYTGLEEVENTIIRSHDMHDIVRVRDVADVSYQYMETRNLSRINGQPVVSLYVQKESDANTVTVADAVGASVAAMREQLPEAVNLEVISNQAIFIKDAIDNVLQSLGLGALLAIGVLYFFLRRLRPTLIIGVAIPLSVVMTLGLMHACGITLNVMSLSGLALGVGMLVDNSIVVLENISRKQDAGSPLQDSCVAGTGEMVLALIASTASTLVVFLPIVFVNAQTRILYGGLSLTVVFSLLSSLVVSILMVPCLFARGGGGPIGESLPGRWYAPVIREYQRMLALAMQYRYYLLGIVLMLLLGSAMYFAGMEKEISQSTNEGKFIVFVELQSGARVGVSDRIVAEVENILETVPEIKTFSSRIEGWSSKIYVQLQEAAVPRAAEIIEQLRQRVGHVGEEDNAFIYIDAGQAAGGTEVLMDIYGYRYKTLLELSSSFTEALKAQGGFFDFKLRYKPGRPEMVLLVNKERAALLGLTVKDIADAAHAKIRGLQATRIFQDGREVECIIRLKERQRRSLEEVMALQVVNSRGQKIALGEVVDFSESLAPSEIWHMNKTRMIQLSATTTRYTLDKAIDIARAELNDVEMPEGYQYRFGGNFEEMKSTYRNLQIAALVMVLLVYMLLASLFESYYQPLVIMVSVPLALIGVALAMMVFLDAITMGVLIGIIMLGGIVVNNAIVLMDHANQEAARGTAPERAIARAGEHRLRPILMTTATTVLGLLPMAWGTGMASNLWSPLAITVIGGLLSATFLTLIVIPATVMVFLDFKELLQTSKNLWRAS